MMTQICIGIVGTGYVARHFLLFTRRHSDLRVNKVLTRRPLDGCTDFPDPEVLTNSLDELLEQCDVVFECSGDPLYATEVVAATCEAGRPVVTMNAEFHVTTGSYFVGKGPITEAEGDQPGSLAALHERAAAMGFRPVVYGNMKAFLNLTPTPDEMACWAARKHITLDKVTSFTDGTKMQIEQALVANHFGATVAAPGMLGLEMEDVEAGGNLLASYAKEIGTPISDYLLFPNAPHGVFIVAEHDEEQQGFLRHVKMGDGPFYLLTRHDVLVHLEVPRTILRLVREGRILLDNGAVPSLNVAAVAKRIIEPGTLIRQGIGSFDVRGVAVKITDYPRAVPIGLVCNARVKRTIEPGQYITFDDVELPESLAVQVWHEIERRSLAEANETLSV